MAQPTGQQPTGAPSAASGPSASSVPLRVAMRVRPPRRDEPRCHVDCDPRIGTRLAVRLPQPAVHEFGLVLGPSCSQRDVYLTCGAPMLEAAFAGQDSLLFSYGSTSSGKTHSMYGVDGGTNLTRLDGVVPTLVTELFKRTMLIEKAGEDKFALTATFVEAQGNHIVDLLADEKERENRERGEPTFLKVHLQEGKPPEVAGARRERVYSSRSLAHLIQNAASLEPPQPPTQAQMPAAAPPPSANRIAAGAAGAAGAGAGSAAGGAGATVNGGGASGESGGPSVGPQNHRILTLELERRFLTGGVVQRTATSRFYFVDLAGAENFDLGAAKAGRWINRGVLAVGRVILALAEGDAHVPYRDYPLTTLFAAILGSRNT